MKIRAQLSASNFIAWMLNGSYGFGESKETDFGVNKKFGQSVDDDWGTATPRRDFWGEDTNVADVVDDETNADLGFGGSVLDDRPAVEEEDVGLVRERAIQEEVTCRLGTPMVDSMAEIEVEEVVFEAEVVAMPVALLDHLSRIKKWTKGSAPRNVDLEKSSEGAAEDEELETLVQAEEASETTWVSVVKAMIVVEEAARAEVEVLEGAEMAVLEASIVTTTPATSASEGLSRPDSVHLALVRVAMGSDNNLDPKEMKIHHRVIIVDRRGTSHTTVTILEMQDSVAVAIEISKAMALVVTKATDSVEDGAMTMSAALAVSRIGLARGETGMVSVVQEMLTGTMKVEEDEEIDVLFKQHIEQGEMFTKLFEAEVTLTEGGLNGRSEKGRKIRISEDVFVPLFSRPLHIVIGSAVHENDS
ncbi:unnamed protein product [Nippostrongylus brasiliensis]|uniref:Uncharacterized protein n=1 Tax=Nippostrongylus brasiliensis TaxID=27835 RepID=A0A158R072_NIPBR|nr:unnamed protein product [Nippostrongylus brasiliensis]